MYDYIKAIASDDKITITVAYSSAKNNIRKEEYLYEKSLNLFRKTTELTTGEEKVKLITQSDFFYAYGLAVGELSSKVPCS